MTCFWDGILKKLNNEDFKLLEYNNTNNINFIQFLKKNNKKCTNVIWQNEKLSEKLLDENYKMVSEFNENNINSGYDCSSCDPFIILICELFKLDINHNYNNTKIEYKINNARRLIEYKSNQSHFY